MGFGMTIVRSAALGFACGLRSMAGLAALAHNRGWDECADCQPAVLRLLRSDRGRIGIAAAAIGESILDKLPVLPARTEPQPLAGRVFFGALSGLLLARVGSRSDPALRSILGAIAGGVGAVLGSFAGYRARWAATRDTRLPDLPVALVEDAIAHASAALAVRGHTTRTH